MWPKGIFKWIVDRTLYISVPFTWNLPEVKKIIEQIDFRYDKIVAGGPAVKLMPKYLGKIGTVNEQPGVLQMVNHQATRTTEGCPNRCGFCGVKKIYPEYKELENFPVLPVVCDDNFLACSEKHFVRTIDKLKKLEWVDFNQGLDPALFTKERAEYMTRLNKPILRFAWDTMDEEKVVMDAIQIAIHAGFPKRQIRCFVLIGWQDTPEEALYRLETLSNLGVTTNPMQYTPLNVLFRKEYVNTKKGWTDEKMMDYMKYWANKRYFSKIPFEDFHRKQRKHDFTRSFLGGEITWRKNRL